MVTGMTALIILCTLSGVAGHIALKFPPARKYAFDFMDNIRTIAPCGIPKGLGPVTDLLTEETINVQWHTPYPHKGGYRIALLDHNEQEVQVFTPTQNGQRYTGANDPTTLSHQITLPNTECRNCSLQLIRQAGEWSAGNCGDYIFYSCADVNILPSNVPNRRCGSHTNMGSMCMCNRTYFGEQCTFKEDCLTNEDCHSHGVCTQLETTFYPRQQCFCDRGWHGRHCQHRSAVAGRITDFSSYKMTELSPEFNLYHKILPNDEIEMVMTVKSTTWVGIGWRPTSFRSGCQYFPHIPGVEPRPTTGPGPTHEPEPEPSRKPEPEPTTCGGRWKNCDSDRCNYHARWEYDASKDEIKFTLSAMVTQSKWVAIGFSDDKVMPATDVYMGWIDNGQAIVSDRWATGRFTPSIDPTQNVKDVQGSYTNGMATISFTRMRNTGDNTFDVMFNDTYCPYFLFAYGGDVSKTTSGDYSVTYHQARYSSMERICVKACPTPEPESENTPVPESETTPEPESENTPEPESTPEPNVPCGNRYAHCVSGTCFNSVVWNYNRLTDEITFTVSAQMSSSQFGWVGVGFTDNQAMSGADIYMGYYNQADDSYVIRDRQAPNGYGKPVKDSIQNVVALAGSYDGTTVSFTFKRKRVTNDTTDYQFSDTKCPYILLASGGEYDTSTDEPTNKHDRRFFSPTKKCINTSTPCTPKPETENTPVPESENTPVSESETTPEPKSENTPEPESTPEPNVPCGNRYAQCVSGTCYNSVVWNYNRLTDEITFTVSAQMSSSQFGWVGVGFTDNQTMSDADIYMGYYNQADDSYVIRDRQAPNGYGKPVKDSIQNIVALAGSYDGTTVSFTFKRKRVTNDTTDYQFSDTKCPYILLASGGEYDTSTDEPTNKHDRRFVSPTKKCINTCDTSTMTKTGYCPRVTSQGICVEECSSDDQCPMDKKCCYNGCGHTCTDASTQTPEPERTPEPEVVVTGQPEGEANPTGEPEGEGETSAEPEGEGEPTGEPEGQGSCGSRPAGSSDTTGNNPHPMDCVDMVVGTARGNRSRIGDFYAHGRSTPMYDSFYGGKENLLGAYGYEENGYTTIIFRKKMSAMERADLPILDEHMHVIWARGQDQGDFVHFPATGIDGVPASSLNIPNYYRDDEFKYHGHSSHRGVTRINFKEGAATPPPDGQCGGSWGTCSDANCHRVTWSYANDMITFTITADLDNDQWVGIGFNTNRAMSGADVIIGWVTADGQVTVRDMKNPTSYGRPTADTSQDISEIQGSRTGRRTTLSFKRPRAPNDAADFSFSETNCGYLFFPKGGSFDASSMSISKHDQTPIISSNMICFPCQGGTQPTPASHMYTVKLRILGVPYIGQYGNVNSQEYLNLKKEVENEITQVFADSRKFQSVWIIRFISGSVIAELGIEMTGNEAETKDEVNRMLLAVLAEGRLGGYTVDKGYSLGLGNAQPVELPTQSPTEEEDEEIHIAVWFIVAIAGATLLLMVVFGICNCMKQKPNQSEKYKQFPNGQQTGQGQQTGHGNQNRMVASQQYYQPKKVIYVEKRAVKPQPYEQWVAENQQKMHYENPGYEHAEKGEYRIETSFL